MHSPVETEVKIRITDLAGTCRRIEALGFQISQPREFESNTLYDTPTRSLFASGTLLRLRESGGRYVITWKGRYQAGPHKTRPELETTLGSLETMARIFGHLGYEPVFRYEKYRREYRLAGQPGVITADETPIGSFLELEGPGTWIDETAQQLGLRPADYVLESYARLYFKDCEQRGVTPTNMVFAT
ncbi:MAG: class IV adenylate cyclase [Bryobacteraceae bacterium]